MKSGDLISSTFWLFFSIIVFFESCRLGLGTLRCPQAGFFPFVASMAMGTLSLILLLSNITKEKRKKFERDKNISFNRQTFSKVLYVLGSLVAYSFLFKILGFILDTMILIGFLLRAVEPQKWFVVVIVSLTVSLIGYFLFGVVLNLQLPKGFLGF